MAQFDPTQSVIDALNSINEDEEILRPVGNLLKGMGDLAPPCAAVPYNQARAELADVIRQWRALAVPEIENPEALVRALDALEGRLNQIPEVDSMWTDAPAQWQVPETRPTGDLRGWSDFWRSAADAAVDAGAGALITIGAVYGAPAIIVGGAVVLVASGVLQAMRGTPTAVGRQTGFCADLTARVKLRLHARILPAIYQQTLAVFMIGRAGTSREDTERIMRSMNPYDLPTMPAGWNGTFAHITRREKGEGNWLLALLVGGLVALGAVVAMEE